LRRLASIWTTFKVEDTGALLAGLEHTRSVNMAVEAGKLLKMGCECFGKFGQRQSYARFRGEGSLGAGSAERREIADATVEGRNVATDALDPAASSATRRSIAGRGL
jgi:hypothetical protein